MLRNPKFYHRQSEIITNTELVDSNDVNNQQDTTTLSFINLFYSALHVSGDKYAHPQEHFLTVYTAFGTMPRHCCRPVHYNKSCVYTVKKCS